MQPAGSGDFARLFIALPIGEDLRAKLCDAVAELRKCGGRIGWVAPPNIHLTMAFLGEVPRALVPSLETALDAVTREFAPFSFHVSGLGTFGGRRAPRVIWAGVPEPPEPLMALQAAIVTALKTLELRAEERAFTAHLTLGRVRSARDAGDLVDRLAAMQALDCGVVHATRILLMQSLLETQGVRYIPLHEAFLRT